MSTYYLSVTDNGSGKFTPSIIRGGTAPSGGTSLTIPIQWNTDGSYGTLQTVHMDDAFMAGMRAALADRASGN